MSASTAIASIGVSILLAAFGLNLRGSIPAGSVSYGLMNTIGAGLACLASAMIGFLPFVVLEGVWCAAGAAATARSIRSQAQARPT